jgi:thymidine phosphorylase
LSPTAGRVGAIHNQKIARAAKLAGAPQDPGAGIFLDKKLGEPVAVGEPIFRVFAESEEELRFSLDYVEANLDLFTIRG